MSEHLIEADVQLLQTVSSESDSPSEQPDISVI